MKNSALQVFAGGWDQLQHAKLKEDMAPAIMGFPVALTWKPDGTKYFVLNAANPDIILEFTANTPHSADGALQTGSFSLDGIEANPRGMYVHLDGSRLWIVGTGADKIIQINMTTPWDLDTAFDPGISVNPGGDGGSLRGITFIKKGLGILLVERNNDEVLEYSLTTPYDLSTFILNPINTLDVSLTSPNPEDIVVKTDDRMMYLVSETNNTVDRYILPTPGSLAGATFVDSLDLVDTMDTAPQALFIRESDGKLLYTIGLEDDKIYTFDMSLTENNTLINELGDELVNELGEPLVAV